ncbi:beta-glucosidase 24-like [Prosopis cineraria]|uniref:beta-glucosidase 24-like n=1 Tax=Prosopis cineraria TaxID=364024 RepID=UPI00240F6E09|nr:beta-glucosidase 24-like [Prosopis cineraria]
MWNKYCHHLLLLLLVISINIALLDTVGCVDPSSFPPDFTFGTSSSSYQYEGAAYEGGKGLSVWDTFTHKFPEKIADRSNGDIATDQYHRYKEDVAIMKDIGFNAYRFSISWPRILPYGNLKGGVNSEGINYYNNLIDELLSYGLQPFVTLFHWDLPQALEDEYGGFLSPKIVKDFADYAELCFREFGDRVKHWITLNEPMQYSYMGYAIGAFPPGRCSKFLGLNCSAGDSSTEPYLVSHYQTLAHAEAVKIYREKYQGQIGVALNSLWFIPTSQSNADKDAASRALAFMYDWFMEPLNSGNYPAVMVSNVGERLPKFSNGQSLLVKGSFDFIGLNYYTTYYVSSAPCQRENQTSLTDACINATPERNGLLIGPKAGSQWLYIYPPGIQYLLQYIKEKFNNPVIYITENGVDEINDGRKSLDDKIRIDYVSHHLLYIQRAMRNGVKVKGYFMWSLLDNFEWIDGYTVRFGLIFVDFKNGLKRYHKRSAWWFKTFLHQWNDPHHY